MSRQPLRLARATAAQVAAYTGGSGEPIFNTETKALHLQDGVTAGGVPLARGDSANITTVSPLGTAIRTFADVRTDRMSPLDFDGVTIGARIQAAIDKCNQLYQSNRSARRVHLPAGTLTGVNLTMKSGAFLSGDHLGATTLISAPNALAPVIGGGAASAPLRRWGLSHLVVDGNRDAYTNFSNRDACSGLDVYGLDYTIEHFRVLNVLGHGLRFREVAIEIDPRDCIGWAQNIWTYNTGRHGAFWEGAHDHSAMNLQLVNASLEADNTWCGLYTNDGGNGRFWNVHPWTSGPPPAYPRFGISIGSSCQMSSCHSEGAHRLLEFRGVGSVVTGSSLYVPRMLNPADALVVFSGGDTNLLTGSTLAIEETVDMFGVQFGEGHNSFQNVVSDCIFNGFFKRGPFNFMRDAGNQVSGCRGSVAGTGGATFTLTPPIIPVNGDFTLGDIHVNTAIEYVQSGGTSFTALRRPNRPTITGSRGSNAALASFLASMASRGDLIDATT